MVKLNIGDEITFNYVQRYMGRGKVTKVDNDVSPPGYFIKLTEELQRTSKIALLGYMTVGYSIGDELYLDNEDVETVVISAAPPPPPNPNLREDSVDRLLTTEL